VFSPRILVVDDGMEGVKAWDLVPLPRRMVGGAQAIVVASEESFGPVRRLRGAGSFYQAMKPVDMEELGSAVVCAFDKIARERMSRGESCPFLVSEKVPA
jgi:hypothetical protein